MSTKTHYPFEARVRQVMNEYRCTYSEACSILGKRAAAKKQAKRVRGRMEIPRSYDLDDGVEPSEAIRKLCQNKGA